MNIDITVLREVASEISGVFAVVLFVYAGYKRWIVWGYQYTEAREECRLLKEERDEWRDLALQNWRVTGKAIEVAEKATSARTEK